MSYTRLGSVVEKWCQMYGGMFIAGVFVNDYAVLIPPWHFG